MKMGKLVRDGIPQLIRDSGGTPSIRKLSDDAYAKALLEKLAEEADELRIAGSAEEVLEESADVLEVLHALVVLHGYTIGELQDAARKKRLERGAFAGRIWLD